MTPFFFGTSSRRLFGIYTAGAARSQRAVVLCHPWGQEYLHAHRSVRHLSTLLTAAGIHVLRFDYFGTGDSAGDMADADLKGWQSDIDTAIEELKDTSGAQRIGLVGLRLGATLAAQAAARHKKDIDKLVLWDPIVKGESYLEELRVLEAERVAKFGTPPDDAARFLGFEMVDGLLKDVRDVDLATSLPNVTAPTLLIASQASPSYTDLGVGVERLPADPVWLELRGEGLGGIPVDVLQRIVGWLT